MMANALRFLLAGLLLVALVAAEEHVLDQDQVQAPMNMDNLDFDTPDLDSPELERNDDDGGDATPPPTPHSSDVTAEMDVDAPVELDAETRDAIEANNMDSIPLEEALEDDSQEQVSEEDKEMAETALETAEDARLNEEEASKPVEEKKPIVPQASDRWHTGNWGAWEPWCKTCYGRCNKWGYKSSTRICHPHGAECEGSDTRKKKCFRCCYKVSGKWGAWNVGKCAGSGSNKSCGWGRQRKSRKASKPQCGGPAAKGAHSIMQRCHTGKCCKVNGKWGGWKRTSCSGSCGWGTRSKFRLCNSPQPYCGGHNCHGKSWVSERCYTGKCCAVDGKWGNWKPGKCVGKCGWGRRRMSRECCAPHAKCGGKKCPGMNYKFERCHTGKCCKVNGRWSRWKVGACYGKCGMGVRALTRACNSPAPSCGGHPCKGSCMRYQPCNTGKCCPVDGKWGQWVDEGCRGKCGWGRKRYWRKCGGRKCGGKNCAGSRYKYERCHTGKCCKVNGRWGSWKYTKCEGKCGTGRRIAYRHCNMPSPSCGGHACKGASVLSQRCYTGKCCKINGKWGGWRYTKCKGKCGWGHRRRYRMCNSPSPKCGGHACRGLRYYNQRCYTGKCCKVDGCWSPWRYTHCYGKCGSTGKRIGYRSCNRPRPSCGGKFCPGHGVICQKCKTRPCFKKTWKRWG